MTPMANSEPLRVRVPGDKSITHRALLLAALAEGESCIRGALAAHDTESTRRVLGQLGVRSSRGSDGAVLIAGGSAGGTGATLCVCLGALAGLPSPRRRDHAGRRTDALLRGVHDLLGSGGLRRLGSDGRVGGFIPLLGGALGIGNAWPSFYEPVRLPGYYESYYDLGPYNSYRYADDVIYRVDPDTSAITSIAALLTGDGKPFAAEHDLDAVLQTL